MASAAAAQRRQRGRGELVPAELQLLQLAHASQPTQLAQPVALELEVLERAARAAFEGVRAPEPDARRVQPGQLAERRELVWLQLSCSPCHKKVCPLGHMNCLNTLDVERVLQAADHLIDAPAAA